MPFMLWPAQREIVPLLSEPRLFILKARQLGLSWLDLAHWLYETTFWGNRLILIARQTLDDCRRCHPPPQGHARLLAAGVAGEDHDR